VDHAGRFLADGKTVMFLTTCSYMLEPLKAVLRARGVPFHNPYRFKRKDWNPMRSADPIVAYLQPHPELAGRPWDGGELRTWTAWLRSEGVLAPDAELWIAAMHSNTPVTPDMLRRVFRPEVLADLIHAITGATLGECLSWWLEHLHAKRQRIGRYLNAVTLRRGVGALTRRPSVVVGTGHSVKGAEADVVYFFPDLSASGMRQWEGSRQDRDAVIRLGYVMMTRARETLVICEPAGPSHMPVAVLARKVRGKP
jgi:hypothetical protein